MASLKRKQSTSYLVVGSQGVNICITLWSYILEHIPRQVCWSAQISQMNHHSRYLNSCHLDQEILLVHKLDHSENANISSVFSFWFPLCLYIVVFVTSFQLLGISGTWFFLRFEYLHFNMGINIKGKPVTCKGKVIKNILKWRKESDTYLTHVCRYHWSRQITMKAAESNSAGWLKAPISSTFIVICLLQQCLQIWVR